MRTSLISIISLVCVVALTSPMSAAPTTRPADLAKENAELRKQLEQQKAEIARLQQRIRELENRQRLNVLVPRPMQPAQPLPRVLVTPPEDHPDGWIPRQFNGIRYYIVPLEHNSTAPAPVAPVQPMPLR